MSFGHEDANQGAYLKKLLARSDQRRTIVPSVVTDFKTVMARRMAAKENAK